MKIQCMSCPTGSFVNILSNAAQVQFHIVTQDDLWATSQANRLPLGTLVSAPRSKTTKNTSQSQ